VTVAKEKEKPDLFVTVSTPWAIRNYFHTGIVRTLAREANVTVLAAPKLAEYLRRDGHALYSRIEEWNSGPEPLAWRLGRQLRKKVYMETRGVRTERIWRRYSRRPLYQRLSAPIIAAATKGLNATRGLSMARSIDLRINKSDVFQELFERSRRGLLFATHADTYFEEAILRSAQARGIPAALMVLSWDHLSTKVVLGSDYERILVWTDLQRDEVLANYPEYEAGQVRVVGIPHYDTYFKAPEGSREDWCRRFGLDPARRTLVYYSMPQIRHNSQHLILEEVAAAIEAGEDLPRDLQILVKCHPFDDPTVYDSVRERHSFVHILPTTLPSGANPMEWLPDPAEIETAKDCLAFADVTTNIYSTVTIEAALFDKPIVHIAFDAAPLPEGRVPCGEYYNFTHFKPIVDTNAAAMARSQKDLHQFLNEALRQPGERAAQRRELAARFLGPMDGRSSDRVVSELRDLLSSSSDRKGKGEPAVLATAQRRREG
jgi:hypothetical protein